MATASTSPPGCRGWRTGRHLRLRKSVRRGVASKLDAQFEDLGEQTLKNIERPMRVYR